MRLFVVIYLFLAGAGFAQMDFSPEYQKVLSRASSAELNKRSDTTDILIYRVYLDFKEASSDNVKGETEVVFQALEDMNTLSLDLQELTVDSIENDLGDNLPFNYNDTLIVVDIEDISASQKDSITVYYHGHPVEDNSGLGGYYRSGTYYYNLGVGIEANPHNFGRVWHPCFDNFAERAAYEYTILTDADDKPYCNGTKTGENLIGVDSLVTIWKMSTPIPTYLAGFAISTYTQVNWSYYSVIQDKDIPVMLVAKEVDTTEFKASFVNLLNIIAAYEDHFGPYMWEKVGYAAVPFNSGAMEHATLVAYPLITIDGTLNFEWIMAHELAHSWWGNWVTTEFAEEMWINEAMATYCELLYREWIYDVDEYMDEFRAFHYRCLQEAHIDDEGHYALDAMPHEHTYGTQTYYKGATFVHTLRSFMGDDNFFAALESIQTNFGGGNINTQEMKDHINSLGFGDYTSFFDDWISQPGYTHYAVVRFESEPVGSNYSVDVVIDQKLRFADHYANNVPLLVTFRDENWNTYEEVISFSGDFAVHNFTVPFEPSFVALNMDEKIADATTAWNMVLNDDGIEISSYANFRLDVETITDSAFIRVEHNWVYADDLIAEENIRVSPNRYWNIHGLDLNKATGDMRFAYNGDWGYLDNELMVDADGQPFNEDSLVLLYRPNADANWTIHPSYNLNTQGSKTDKTGYIETEIETLTAGQYTLGYRTYSLGNNENPMPQIKFYPNPASNFVNIDLSEFPNQSLNFEVYNILGSNVITNQIQGGQTYIQNLFELENGHYIFKISTEKRTLITKKILVSH